MKKKEKQVEKLEEAIQQNDDLKQELDDAKIENTDLKDQIDELQAKVDDLEERGIYIPPEIEGGTEPIHLIFFGGSMLQETNVMAPPFLKMDAVILNYCNDQKLPITKYTFYTKPDGIGGKKTPVNYNLTAHGNGYVNGTRILIEKAENNSTWNRDADVSE